ncbi:MAG: imidazoleglycerol-phosphate dehydratase HisB [Lachnospiraceae bacterium]|nr:imidazoleglycerol-phosphate dehydratase HisB [Lachnospiraceae bacterium]
MRKAEIKRETKETKISLFLELDGTGVSQINSGVGFLDHMLTLFAKHSRFDLRLNCTGDTQVDDHHSVEDIGICLGQAFREALGNKTGICRYGDCILPMDETLILSAADISGRGWYEADLELPTEKIGDFDTELIREFFTAFALNAGITLHIRKLCGINSHHIAEGAFKSVARSLRKAAAIDPEFADDISSTKGILA